MLPRPSWPVFRRRLDALEARIVDVPLVAGERTYTYDVEALLGAITKRTKLLVVCTPNNPTGNSLTLDEVWQCAAAGPLLLLYAAYADFDEDVDVTPRRPRVGPRRSHADILEGVLPRRAPRRLRPRRRERPRLRRSVTRTGNLGQLRRPANDALLAAFAP